MAKLKVLFERVVAFLRSPRGSALVARIRAWWRSRKTS